MTTIYTDGASRGNPGPGGWAAIIFDDNNYVKEIGGRESHTTNNKMELTAAIKALEAVDSTQITVYTDAEYVAKGMGEWIHSWVRRNWKTANKKPVLNQDLWQKLSLLSQGKNIEWKYVPGHSGNKLNERCDEIATAFADNLEPTLYHGPKDQYQ